MVLKIKSLPSFEREDHVESKYIIRTELWLFEIPKKGAKLKMYPEMTLDDL